MIKDRRFNGILGMLRRLTASAEAAVSTDPQLMDRFLQQGDEGAFEQLLRKHGPMVMGVCRRVLGENEVSEDAFQATFLVFVRKARTIARRERLGNWLYGVAQRTALRARALRVRRQTREAPMEDLSLVPAPDQPTTSDLRPILDDELGRLPEKYRVAVVLCDLQSRSRKEAALELGWSEGTLSSRLARAKQILHRRLARRGVALGAAALAGDLAAAAAPAGVSPALLKATLDAGIGLAAGQLGIDALASAAVANLTKGVLHTMFMTRLRITVGFLLCLGGLGLAGAIGLAGLSASVPDRAATDTEHPDGLPNADVGEKIKELIPEAAGVPNEVFRKLGREDFLIDKLASHPLTLVLLSVEPANGDFEFNNEIPGTLNPAKLAEMMSKSRLNGYATAIQPESITEVTCRVKGDQAKGTVSFRGLFFKHLLAKGEVIYTGKVEFTARRTDMWRIEEFRLPNHKIRVVRQADGTWKRIMPPDQNSGL